MEMGNLKDGIDKATNRTSWTKHANTSLYEKDVGPARPSPAASREKPIGPKENKVDSDDEFDKMEREEKKQQYEAWSKKKGDKDFKKNKETVMEELVPKATGREAMFEKKKQKAAYTKSTKDADMGEELKDKDLYGGSSDFQRRVQKQRQAKIQKTMAKIDEGVKKIEDYKRKEDEKMAPFREMLKGGAQNIPLLAAAQQRGQK